MSQPTIAAALRAAAEALEPVSETARLDAELLMAEAAGITRSDLVTRFMQEPPPAGFAALLARRMTHEPVAYILGRQEFYGREFVVSPATLIPRPDSETLIDAALHLPQAHGRVLDLGTGTGALLLTVLAEKGGEGWGTDRSAEALGVARRNAAALGLESRARLLVADWSRPGWAHAIPPCDLVLCNPPYVESDAPLARDVAAFEPHGALFAGPQGLDDYRLLAPQLRGLLAQGGAAIFEIGHQQGDAVAALFAAEGFASRLCRDLAGRPRALVLT